MGWTTVKLGEICNIELGRTPARKRPRYWDPKKEAENVWLSIADLPKGIQAHATDSKEYISNEGAEIGKLVKAGTLLVSFKLTLGRLAYAGRDLYTNEAIAALTIIPGSRLNQEYLYWYLTFFDWHKAAVGHEKVKGKTLNKAKLKELDVFVPPLFEQQRIVAILDEAFNWIDAAGSNAEKNLANARELFEGYLNNVFTQKGDNDVRLVRIEDVCDSIVDCLNRTAPKVETTTPYKMIRTTNVRYGRVDLDKVKYVSEDIFQKWTRRQVPKRGDILLTREAPVGEVGMIATDDNVFLGQRIVSYRVSPEHLDNSFLLYALQSPNLQKQISSFASGSTVQHMRVPDTKELMLRLPTLDVQIKLVKRSDEILSSSQHLETIYQQKLDALAELKQSILQKAFSGGLTSKEIAA